MAFLEIAEDFFCGVIFSLFYQLMVHGINKLYKSVNVINNISVAILMSLRLF